ncbi:CS1 type fimbrial major subunit (plasmid) [Embleya sp. NBC_00888]|uniref:CS1 type fimbrial major subunit n=1 Tax=Embleya sp. NBC_00888 TaxID=2975960 RepID=UPI00386F185A|nr:CS1 type fimbrial major subunit [Embleya sp. NBC_00888]
MTDSVNDGAPAPTTLSIAVKNLSDIGLEPQLRSWISPEPNEPVTAEQLTRAIGQDQLARAAASLDREPDDLAAELAAALPGLVDTASPDGRLELTHTRDEAGAIRPRHTSDSVGAYVEADPRPVFNGSNTIALTYTFNGVTLTGTGQEVVGDTESNAGMRADLVITATKPTATQTGLYTATPVVIFDAIPR